MPLLSSLAVSFVAWAGKVFGIKLGLLAVAIATVTAVLAATRVAFDFLLFSLGAVNPIPADIQGAIASLAPTNIDDVVVAIIDAYVLRLLFMAQWVYVKLYITSASWRVL